MLTPNVTWLDLCLAAIGAYLAKQALNKKTRPISPWPPWVASGPISHIEVLGQHIIVLNSVKSAVDMLDKKGTVYSDRPVLPMAGKLVGWKHVLALLPYGDHFRQQRKNIHQIMGNRAALHVYHPIEEIEASRFLKRVFSNPEQLQAHVRHTAGAIILRISYGYEVKESDDPFVDIADRAMDQFSAPGAFVVDTVPFLANVPEWFPGAVFKRLAREWTKTCEDMVTIPYKFVQDQMDAGIAPVSFTSNHLGGHTLSAEEDHVVKWSAASLYAGVAAIYSFFLAMTLFPDVQKKAQAEIDAIVGPDRLPSFADRDSLPYTEALVKEVFRWHVVGPTAIPHRVTEDDIHDGYYIPKGSLVLLNIWFMLNDPQTYANPSQFNPERFLDNNGKDPELNPARSALVLVD
ncbi:cytochrome P450, partial [Suillus decipiens]